MVSDLVAQNLSSVASSIISGVGVWLILRLIRSLAHTREATEELARNAEASAGNAAADASTTRGEIERLTTIVERQAAAIEDMAHRYDTVWSKFLTNDVLDMRLKRVEKYLAEHELDRKQAAILGAFTDPVPVQAEGATS